MWKLFSKKVTHHSENEYNIPNLKELIRERKELRTRRTILNVQNPQADDIFISIALLAVGVGIIPLAAMAYNKCKKIFK